MEPEDSINDLEQSYIHENIPRRFPRIRLEGLFTEIQARVQAHFQQMDDQSLRSQLLSLNDITRTELTLYEHLFNIVFAAEYILLSLDSRLLLEKAPSWPEGLRISSRFLQITFNIVWFLNFEDKDYFLGKCWLAQAANYQLFLPIKRGGEPVIRYKAKRKDGEFKKVYINIRPIKRRKNIQKQSEKSISDKRRVMLQEIEKSMKWFLHLALEMLEYADKNIDYLRVVVYTICSENNIVDDVNDCLEIFCNKENIEYAETPRVQVKYSVVLGIFFHLLDQNFKIPEDLSIFVGTLFNFMTLLERVLASAKIRKLLFRTSERRVSDEHSNDSFVDTLLDVGEAMSDCMWRERRHY